MSVEDENGSITKYESVAYFLGRIRSTNKDSADGIELFPAIEDLMAVFLFLSSSMDMKLSLVANTFGAMPYSLKS